MTNKPACAIHTYLPGPPPCSICMAEVIEAQAETMGSKGYKSMEESLNSYNTKQGWMAEEMTRRMARYKQGQILDYIIEKHDKDLSGSGESQ